MSAPGMLTGCPAPAKLNLFLHVVGRRPDGYHLLQSVFQLIDRADLLDFRLRGDDAIRRTTEVPGVPEDADLVVRAARLLRDEAGRPLPGVDIALTKRLPLGGGLGGGSSDAATTLIALNRLWNLGFDRTRLAALGLRLGADVPFFLSGLNAFVEGIGERMTPVETRDCWFVVVEPGVAVPTAAIFGAPELTRDTKPVRITDFSEGVAGFQTGFQAGFGRNDLQDVAVSRFGAVAEALGWLKQHGDARMTGSGACVFCPFEREAEADAALAALPPRWTGWKAKALQRHPLAHWLAP